MSNQALRPTRAPFNFDDDDLEASEGLDTPKSIYLPWLRTCALVTTVAGIAAYVLGTLLASGRDPLFSTSALSEGFSGNEGVASLVVLHRVIGVIAFLLSLVLAAFLFRFERRHWIRTAAVSVCLCGLVQVASVGGWFEEPGSRFGLSLIHPLCGQLFVALLALLAYGLSKEIIARENIFPKVSPSPLFLSSLLFLGVILFQILSGTLVRVTNASLAIPDFPLMGGGLLPFPTEATLITINDLRANLGLDPTTQGHVWIHLIHRLGSIAVLMGGFLFAYALLGSKDYRRSNARTTVALLACLLLMEAVIGIVLIGSLLDPIALSLHMILSGAICVIAMRLAAQLKHDV